MSEIDASPATATANNTVGHEPGLGQFGWTTGSTPAPSDPNYAYGNLIGTTEAMMDDTSSVSRRAVFTAFGEPVYEGSIGVPPVDSRYGYAGAWGYQEPSSETSNGHFIDPLADIGWLHVGARYYDPAAGRFMQRDPIGIRGGFNTYAYCLNNPVDVIDPLGLGPWDDLIDWVACNYWLKHHSHEYLQSGWATAEGIGVSVVGGIAAGKAAGLALNPIIPKSIYPWLGKVANHGAHAGGPHQYPHLQFMLRTGASTTKHGRIPLWP